MNSYKKQQRVNTLDYIKKDIDPYATKISIQEMDSLLNTIGLYIDYNESWQYYNTSNEKNFLCYDLHVYCKKSKKHWCNIYSDWYKENINKGYTETYRRLKEIRNNYYSIYKHALVEI